ncbi:cell division protein FtsZ [Paradevosia shaoguanensis]|uniref:Cell division protein FtsZ n=1 Tax=Paradevosia shaoguanensis TaxID=1335043 RepID=A0AA41UBS0_9HYPH|nr:cell division protein FtsZ [Paradevosia shaoguanensis]MCF1743330.1 cell division protein FtsZ [Paradevosia shaoguanensis]MCI0127813.1 cell division protein FtsZ [Paradevosia shaoguanensis]
MPINLTIPDIQELKPRITVFGCGGAGGNAVNNMINSGLDGVDFVVANTDAQALALSKASRIIQLGVGVTEGLGAGSHPEVGRAAAEESYDEINDHLSGSHMVFITAGMGGGTGTGAAPVVARAAREQGILTVGVVTKPFAFEGNRRARLAEDGIDELHRHVDTLIVIPNQNLFRVANEKTTFADAFAMADQVLYSGVACITDLMVKEGLINLDFADVRAVMRGMGKAMMGTGEASGEDRARHAAEAAIANPLLDDVSMHGARGLLISIAGGPDLTLYEVDEAASRIREEVDADANIILGAMFDPTLDGTIRVSVVATGTDATMVQAMEPVKPNAARAIAVKRPHVPYEAPAPAPQPIPQPAARVVEEQIEEQVEHAIAEAIVTHEPIYEEAYAQDEDDGIMVEPYIPSAIATHDPVDEPTHVQDAPIPSVYVPSNAARPEARRMPRTEELPAVARRSLAAQERHEPEANPARALLKRLASNVGLSSRPRGEAEEPVMQQRETDDAAARSAIEAGGSRGSVPTHGARGNTDAYGRPAQPQPAKDHLEIPAFLRKHG